MTQQHPWQLQLHDFDANKAAYQESLLAIGNGYLGVRGAFDEGYPDNTPKTHASAFINGLYESLPIEYDESAYGFAKNNHRMVPAPYQRFQVVLDGQMVNFQEGVYSDHTRTLDFQSGLLKREFVWQSPAGKRLAVIIERGCSFLEPSLYRARISVKALNCTAEVEVRSELVRDQVAVNEVDDPRKGGRIPDAHWGIREKSHLNNQLLLQCRTKNSGFALYVAAEMISPKPMSATEIDDGCRQTVQMSLEQGECSTVNVAVCYADTRFIHEEEAKQKLVSVLSAAQQQSFEQFVDTQQQYLAEFWQQSDIEIESTDDAQYATRFALFHLLQSTGRDGHSAIAAKGVTGSGYDGHYFWDTETYIFPFWLFSQPDTAKALLQYRINTLPSAKKRARQMGHSQGALFAWRTIGGEECSSYFPAGTAQYHINADIAYAARSYYLATEDVDFLVNGLAELVVETARIWPGLGHFDAQGRFQIFGVTGPDEYTAVVNNNFYTNKMVQMHAQFALDVIGTLQATNTEAANDLLAQLAIGQDEMVQLDRLAKNMFLPFNHDKQIYEQDDSFLQKPRWDFEGTPKDKYPLLLNFHPLVIYRHQVLKQADTLLGLLLSDTPTDAHILKNCFDYYEPINTHDSTLSPCVHGVIASEIGYHQKAYDYYLKNITLDLDDAHHNTYYGIHTAAMGGVWMGAVQGFAGLRYSAGVLSLKPSLPDSWQRMAFRLRYKSRVLRVELTHDAHHISLEQGSPIEVLVNGQPEIIA